MKTFSQYVEDVENNGILGDFGVSGASGEESLVRIARLVAKHHSEDLLNFFRELSKNDPSIRHELDNMNRNDANRPLSNKSKLHSAKDKDQVVPYSSDSGGELEAGEGGF